VNLEADVIGKHVARLIAAHQRQHSLLGSMTGVGDGPS
jgi:hypothetical protein